MTRIVFLESGKLMIVLVLLLIASSQHHVLPSCHAFSASSPATAAQELAAMNKNRLQEALSSPSGKLTVTPELILGESDDPTALLLQSHSIQTLSQRLRTSKSNAVLIRTPSLTTLQTIVREQETARGNFPGPIPVLYQMPSSQTEENNDDDDHVDLNEVAQAGVQGVVITLEMDETFDVSSTSTSWQDACKVALAAGLQPIPEFCMTTPSTSAKDTAENDETVQKCVNQICQTLSDEKPIAVLITATPPVEEEAAVNNDDEEDDEPALPELVTVGNQDNDDDVDPFAPAAAFGADENTEKEEDIFLSCLSEALKERLGGDLSVLGSIRVPAGENRLGREMARYKRAGYTGTVLRHECLPNNPAFQQDLDWMGQFWAACIADLKSTKSKAFSFRAKNNMDISLATQWQNYKAKVVESGALGDPNEALSDMVDHAKGDYKGF